MPTFTAAMTLTYGDTTPNGAVPAREPYTFTFDYTQTSIKEVSVAASQVDSPITLDSVSAPVIVFVQAVVTDITVKLVHNSGAGAATALSASGGWAMIVSPDGQPINSLLVTTPASPSSGAILRILSFA